MSQIIKTSSGGGGGGNVTGPGSSTVGDIVLFNNTTGTLISDSGVAFPIPVSSGGIGATSLTLNSLLLGNGTGNVSALGAALNGQIPIGSTGNAPVLANLIAGANITITNAPGSVTIAASGGTGNVTGPGSSTNNDIAVFSGTTGKIIADGGVTIASLYPAASVSATQFDLIVGGSGNTLASITNGASGTLFQSAGASANGGYTTSTYPSTNAKGDLLYGSASNVISDLNVSTYYGAPLIATDTGVPAYLSPRNYVWLYDEFCSGTTTSQLGWESQFINSGTLTPNASTSTSANPGVFQLNTNANTAGTASIKLAETNGACGCFLLGGGLVSTVFYCKLPTLSTGTDTYSITIGLIDVGSNLVTITDGVYFTYSDSGSTPNWVINSTKASSTTTQTSNTAADTNWHRFRIDINAAASSVAYYIDDVALNVSPLSTNIPTAQIAPVFIILKSAGTNNRTLLIDYFTYYQNLTSSR